MEETSLQLQNQLEMNDSELGKFHSLEEEIAKVKAENCLLLQELVERKAELDASLREKNILDVENETLQDSIFH